MTVRAVAWWVVSSLVAGAGCGPKTPGGVEGSSTTDASEGGESGVGSGESGSEGGVPTSGDPDGGSEASGASEAGESSGEPVDACEDPGDPLDTSGGYQLCRGGWVMFRAHDFTDGSQGYTAYAQFYEVLEEEKIVWDEVVHDPFTGLGDCGARTIGNSGIGPIGQTLSQDAGELRFDGPEFSMVAVQSGDPQSVINYDASMSEQGVQPGFGGLHGFVTDGASVPALDMTDAVRLPDRIELLTPGPEAEVGREEFVVTWTPSPLASPMLLFLHFDVADDRRVTVYCQLPDTGSFQVPAALLELAPLPLQGQVLMQRSDVRMLPRGDGRMVRVSAEVSRDAVVTVL